MRARYSTSWDEKLPAENHTHSGHCFQARPFRAAANEFDHAVHVRRGVEECVDSFFRANPPDVDNAALACVEAGTRGSAMTLLRTVIRSCLKPSARKRDLANSISAKEGHPSEELEPFRWMEGLVTVVASAAYDLLDLIERIAGRLLGRGRSKN